MLMGKVNEDFMIRRSRVRWINRANLGAHDSYCHCIIISSKVYAETNEKEPGTEILRQGPTRHPSHTCWVFIID